MRRGSRRSPCATRGSLLGLVLVGVFCSAGCALAPEASEPEAGATETRAGVLRVGTSGDYPPFSDAPTSPEPHPSANWLRWLPFRSGAAVPHPWAGPDPDIGDPRGVRGFDVDLARAFARDRGLALDWVPFRWPELSADLEAQRFDVAMSGVTVRPERSLVGRYSLPLVDSGAVVLLGPGSDARTIDALDRAGVRIGVNRGGHLERVARAHFRRASVVAMPTNDAVVEALRTSSIDAASAADAGSLPEGFVDAVVTDTLEAPIWQLRVPGSRRLGPFTTDRKALLVRSNAPALSRALDGWLLERERDGSLRHWRAEHLGNQNALPATALPLPALLAALDERLALMPAVAEAKRRSGGAVEDRGRERRVIEAGLRAAAVECESAFASSGAEGVDLADRCARFEPGVRALLRASIEAAKAIQERVLAAESGVPSTENDAAPLLDQIRPALIRIGDRIAWLAVRLPPGSSGEPLRASVTRELRQHELDAARIDAFTEAIASLSEAATAYDRSHD